MANLHSAPYNAELNRRDITVSPVSAAPRYQSDFASDIIGAIGGGAKAYFNGQSNEARDGLYRAQTAGVNLDNTGKQRKLTGQDIISAFLDDDDLDGAKIASEALRSGVAAEDVARAITLRQANQTAPVVEGMSPEQSMVGNMAVATGNGLSEGESMDVGRAQGILDTKNATVQRGQDVSAAANRYGSDQQLKGVLGSANIRAASDQAVAKASTTTTTTSPNLPKMTQEDFDLGVQTAIMTAVPGAAKNYAPSPRVTTAVARKAEARISQGETPQSAFANAAAEVITGKMQGRRVEVASGILSKTIAGEPNTSTKTKVVEKVPGRATPRADQAAKPAAKAAAAAKGQKFDEPPPASQFKGKTIRNDDGSEMISDGVRWVPKGA